MARPVNHDKASALGYVEVVIEPPRGYMVLARWCEDSNLPGSYSCRQESGRAWRFFFSDSGTADAFRAVFLPSTDQ